MPTPQPDAASTQPRSSAVSCRRLHLQLGLQVLAASLQGAAPAARALQRLAGLLGCLAGGRSRPGLPLVGAVGALQGLPAWAAPGLSACRRLHSWLSEPPLAGHGPQVHAILPADSHCLQALGAMLRNGDVTTPGTRKPQKTGTIRLALTGMLRCT